MKSLPKQPLLMFPIDLSEKIFFAYNCVCLPLFCTLLFYSFHVTVHFGQGYIAVHMDLTHSFFNKECSINK